MNQIINIVTWCAVIFSVIDTYKDLKNFYKKFGFWIKEAWKSYRYRILVYLFLVIRALIVQIVYALNQK